MAKCKVLSRPSENSESKLYDVILNEIANGNEEYANELFAHFETQEFIDDFGDWIKDYETRTFNEDSEEYNPPIVNESNIYLSTGEPKLNYDAAEDTYYYVSRIGAKRPFPLKKRGLNTIYTNSEILSITEMLAANYIGASIGDDFSSLDFSNIQEVLSKSIEKKLESVINKLEEESELGDEDAELKMYDLDDSRAFINEWEQRVKDYFQSKKLIYKEIGNADVLESAEESPKDPNFSQASFERSTKENISTNVKLRLSILRDPSIVDDLFGEPILIPFNAVYSVLLSALNNKVAITDENGNIENIYNIFLTEIEKLAVRKPYLNSLLRQLKGEDEFGNKVVELDDNIKNEFVQAFNLHKNSFISTELTKDDDGNVILVKDISAAGSKARTVHGQWYTNFKAKFAPGSAYGTGAPNYNELVMLAETLGIVKLEFKKKRARGEYNTQEEINKPIEFLRETLHDLGITMTPKGLDLYLDDNDLLPKSDSERLDKLNESFNDLHRWVSSIVKLQLDPTKSNILDNQTIFNDMASAEAFYLSDETDATVYSAGKTKWLFSNPTYLSTKVLVWKRKPELLYNLLQTEYGSSSLFAKHLLALDVDESSRERVKQQRLNELDVTIFNTFQETGGTVNAEAVDNKSIPKNDFTADSINKSLQRIPYYYTPTPADKGTHYMLKIGKSIKVNAEYNSATDSIRVSEETEKIFLDYFISEYARIAKVFRDKKTIDSKYQTVHYHTGRANGLKSQLFPTLSHENFKKVKKNYSFTLYNTEGEPIHKDLTKLIYTEKIVKERNLDPSLIGRNMIINEFIAPTLSENIQRTYKDMFTKSIFEKMEDGSIFSHGVDKGIVGEYMANGKKQYALRITADALINGIISQVEYAKLFAGDMAFYKDAVDYKKRIPATYTDGLQLALEKGQEKFNISVTSSIEVPTPYLDELKAMLPERIWKHYTEINSADAQAWITPQRWRFLMEGLGKWNDTYTRLYDKMMSGEDYTLTPAELKKVAQPLKGVYFDINKGNTPVYLKYSQAVLIPHLIKNTPLQKMYDKMIAGTEGKHGKDSQEDFNKQIHEVITVDGIKVGAITPVDTHNADGTMMDDFDLTIMSLKNSGWKLQQDLPTKTFKMTAIGTQLQKNIFAGLANNPDEIFTVADTDMTGIELYHHMNRIVKSLSDKGKGALIDEFGIRTGNKIGNYSRVYGAMIAELKERNGNKDIIAALEAEISPYGIPQAKKTLMNIFSSIMLKSMVKVKTNGGAFIQMSNYGLSKSDGDNKGVIWSPALAAEETAAEPRYLRDEDGQIVYREVEKKDKEGKVTVVKLPVIRPGGILISGSFLAKYVPDYRKYAADPERLFGRFNKNTGKYESYTTESGEEVTPLIDREILQGLVGYRIPNQGLASNDALEIVGILPEAAGDTVVAYTGITKKTGSDFDIDKMYMMMPSFVPYRGMNSRLVKHLKQEFDGNKLEDIVQNINVRIAELGVSYDVTSLAREILNNRRGKKRVIDSEGNKLPTLNELLSEFIEVIQDSNPELENSFAKEIKTIAKEDGVERLIYYKPQPNIPLERQSKGALNNQLIEAYRAVLLSPHTIADVMTPIDFEFMKSDINTLFKKEDATDLDDFNPFKDIELKYEFMAGKAGVGQEANALVDHNRGRMANTYFKDMYLGRGSYIEIDGAKSSTLDKEYSEEISKTDLNLYLSALNKPIIEANSKEKDESKHKKLYTFEEVEDLSKIKIADSISAVLNAFVDIAKDPYITRGNWTTQTTNTGNMLLRAGFHPFYVNAFLGQPFVKDYIEYVTTKESRIIRDTGNLKDKFRLALVNDKLDRAGNDGTPKVVIFNNVTKNYSSIYSSLVKTGPDMEVYMNSRDSENGGIDTSLKNFSVAKIAALFNITNLESISFEEKYLLQDMRAHIIEIHNSIFFADKVDAKRLPLKTLREQITDKASVDPSIQIAVLNQFFEWQEHAKTLRQSVMASKLDVDGYGKSIGELISVDNTIAKLLNPNKKTGDFVGFDEKLIKDGQLTLLGAYKRNIVDWVKDLMQANPIMFFEAQPYVINTFNEISKDIKEDLLVDTNLADELEKSYYTYLMSGFTPLKTSFEEKIDLIVNLPIEFNAFKDINIGKNKLIDALSTKVGSDNKVYIILTNREKDTQYEEELIAGWEDLLNRPETREFGEKLIRYAYLTSGFVQSTTQFFTYIPTSWFIEKRIDNYLVDTAAKMNQWNNSNKADNFFIDQVYRNNIDNNVFVPNVFTYVNIVEGDKAVSGFTIPFDPSTKYHRKYVKKKVTVDNVPTNQLYKLVGYNKKREPIYIKVTALSSTNKQRNKIVEYKFHENIEISDLGKNAIKVSQKAISELKEKIEYPPNHFDIKIETGELEMIDNIERAELENLDNITDC